MRSNKRKTHNYRKKFSASLDKTGKYLLATAEEIWKQSDNLDTAVRDNISQGLAYIVSAGNDCVASNLNFTTEQWMSFIDNATANWFRNRGFAEWFCIAAATHF